MTTTASAAKPQAGKSRWAVPALLAAATAAAIATASPAAASANPADCRESGTARICQKQGHSSLHTKPTVRGTAGGLFGSAWLPGYGRGQLPPLIALD